MAFGVTLHLAARLQEITKPGTTLCSSETKQLAGGSVEMLPLGRRSIRGFAIDQDLFELTQIRQGHQRFDIAAAVGQSPYVGRNHEQELLQKCIDAVRVGRVVRQRSLATPAQANHVLSASSRGLLLLKVGRYFKPKQFLTAKAFLTS